MALEGTHIRFALEFKEKLGVKADGDYFAGCLYPDTRYKTGIERALTHPHGFEGWDLAIVDDFKKGWYTHLLCDIAQGKVFREKFPQLFVAGEVTLGNETWIGLTAVKLLQDISDANNFDITALLPSENNARTFNGEDMDTLRLCYRMVAEYYAKPSGLSIGGYAGKLVAFGLEKEYAERIVEKAKVFSQDAAIMRDIGEVYAASVAMAEQMIKDARP